MATSFIQTSSPGRAGRLAGSIVGLFFGMALATGSAGAAVTFSAPVNYTVADGPQDVVAADFNGDGLPDLAVAANSGKSVAILLNNPLHPGQFLSPVIYSLSAGPTALAVADFNGDGRLDIAALCGAAKHVVVLNNTGAGAFGIAGTYAAGSQPFGITAGALTSSGRPDLIIADTSGVVSVLKNTGSGAFSAPTSVAVGSLPRSVTIADFDGDGLADVAAGSTGDRTIAVLKGDGTGRLTRHADIKVAGQPYSVHSVQSPSSGRLDLVAGNYSGGGIIRVPGLGGGAFGTPEYVQGGEGNMAIGVGDFNADGMPDIVSANYFSKDAALFVAEGQSLSAPYKVAPDLYRNNVAVADFDGNGLADIALSNNGNSITVVLNNSVFVGGFKLQDPVVPAGMATRGTISLTGPAPAGGTLIALSTVGAPTSSVATVPPDVTIPAGETSVSFDVVGWNEGTATITANINGRPQTATLVVGPPPGGGGGGPKDPPVLNGDVDGDGRITLNDIVILLRTANGDGEIGS